MEINTDNSGGLYEGVITSDDENYWISQGSTAARLKTNRQQNEILENYEQGEDIVSVIGQLENGLEDNRSNIGRYQIFVNALADFEGKMLEENTYVTSYGDKTFKSYSNNLEEIETDFEDVIRKVDDIEF